MRKSKNPIFTTFCFPWGRLWGNHAKCCMNRKRIRCWKENSMLTNCLAACTNLCSTVSQLFEPQLQKKLSFLRTPAFIFCLPWVRRSGNRKTLHEWKDNSVLAKPLAACTYLLKSMRKSKNRYFYHIFDSPGDAPGAITLNVVWMERDFDAYKLSRCMCPSIYNGLWDRARYFWKKNRHFIIPSCIRRPR